MLFDWLRDWIVFRVAPKVVWVKNLAASTSLEDCYKHRVGVNVCGTQNRVNVMSGDEQRSASIKRTHTYTRSNIQPYAIKIIIKKITQPTSPTHAMPVRLRPHLALRHRVYAVHIARVQGDGTDTSAAAHRLERFRVHAFPRETVVTAKV